MNDAAEMIVEALKQREESVGASILWGAQRYPCSGGEVLGGKTLQEGGWRLKAQATIVVRVEVFPAPPGPPQEKQRITYFADRHAAGRGLRIDSLNPLWSQVLVLECNDPNQGASSKG